MPSRQPIYPPDPTRPKPSFLFLTITIFSSLIILFAILYFLYYLYYSLIQRARTSPFDSGPTSPSLKLHRFSFKELKSATQCFHPDTSLGKGGSGTVYRGILTDGKLVAVKLLDSSASSFQAEREFQNELQILGRLNSPFLVSLLGYCVDEKGHRLVVYEYMPNRSLQELLFSESLNLNWARRFEIILDVSRALAFLHLECDPPVIHGDVKPSNVLLDSEFRAKISDFGLSRLKTEEGDQFVVDLFSQDLGTSQDLWKSQDLSGTLAAVGGGDSGNEVDFALALQASSSSKNTSRVVSQHVRGLSSNSLNINGSSINESDCRNVKGKEVFSVENGGDDWNDERCSNEHSRELNLSSAGEKQWGKDWWWKQDEDGSDELCTKDYVTEWIGSQIGPSANPDWDDDKKSSPRKLNLDNSTRVDKFENASDTHYEPPGVECVQKGIENDELREWKQRPKKHRKMQEWWKEEHLDELQKKSDSRLNKIERKCKKGFKMPRLDLGRRLSFRRRRKSTHNQNERGDPNTEFSFRKTSKKKNDCSGGSDMWSGDLFSRELSSTTSMRGTLCYVAPEYGGTGYLMEKADIYSLGVLILVIVSGRRPLHVLASPMKLEKANLISWCRTLAQNGDILELVDDRLKDEYNKEQASLCINLALACLQRMPELRPDVGDIVKILRGEIDLPRQPFEFSPSPPPSRNFSRSRRKHTTVTE